MDEVKKYYLATAHARMSRHQIVLIYPSRVTWKWHELDWLHFVWAAKRLRKPFFSSYFRPILCRYIK